MVFAGTLSVPAFAINLQPGFDTGPLAASQVTPSCQNWSKNLSCADNNQQAVDDVVDQLSSGGGGSSQWTTNSTGDTITPNSPYVNIQTTGTVTNGGETVNGNINLYRQNATITTTPTNLSVGNSGNIVLGATNGDGVLRQAQISANWNGGLVFYPNSNNSAYGDTSVRFLNNNTASIGNLTGFNLALNSDIGNWYDIGGVLAVATNVTNGSVTGDLTFNTYINSAKSERMRILSNGNVLINSATDDGSGSQLQVNGMQQIDNSGDVHYLILNTTSGSDMRAKLNFANNGTINWELGTDYPVDGTDNLYIYNRLTAATNAIFNSDGSSNFGDIAVSGFNLASGASSGYVLTSDGSGNGTWQAGSGGGGYWNPDGSGNIYFDTGNVFIGNSADNGSGAPLQGGVNLTNSSAMEFNRSDTGDSIGFGMNSSMTSDGFAYVQGYNRGLGQYRPFKLQGSDIQLQQEYGNALLDVSDSGIFFPSFSGGGSTPACLDNSGMLYRC
jgi:hypothetical protein